MATNIQTKLRQFRQQVQLPTCSRLNLNFTCHKPKSPSSSLPKPLPHAPRDLPFTYRKPRPSQRQQPFNRTSANPFPHSHSSSFQTSRKFYDNSVLADQQNQESDLYRTRYGFPMRKKLSGEQGLIKLILKRSTSPTQSEKYHHQMQKMRSPLFDPDVQTHIKIIPRLKNRARFNWNRFQERLHRERMSCEGRGGGPQGMGLMV